MDNVGIQIDQMIRKLKRKPQAPKRFCDYTFATDEATNIVLDAEITPHMLHAVPGDVYILDYTDGTVTLKKQ